MKKWAKLGLYALLLALLGLLLWLSLGQPRFTAESAFRRVEQREMLAPSTLLGRWESIQVDRSGAGANSGRWRTHLMAGRTDSHLRLTTVEQRGTRWNSPHDLTSYPLETYTFGVLPWDGPQELQSSSWAGECGFLYTKEPYARGEAILKVGEKFFKGQFTPGPADITFFSFPGLSGDSQSDMDSLARMRLRGITVISRDPPPHISLELVLYDGQGGEIARVVEEYPSEFNTKPPAG